MAAGNDESRGLRPRDARRRVLGAVSRLVGKPLAGFFYGPARRVACATALPILVTLLRSRLCPKGKTHSSLLKSRNAKAFRGKSNREVRGARSPPEKRFYAAGAKPTASNTAMASGVWR